MPDKNVSIQMLREFLERKLDVICSGLTREPLADVPRKMSDSFKTLKEQVNERLDLIENSFAAIQSTASPKKPSRNWHYVVLAGGVMFTVGLISGAVLGTLGALG